MHSARSLVLSVIICVVICAVARATDDEMAKKRAAEVGLQPGMMLDQSTAVLAKGLLPPEILKHYESGEFANRIADNYPANGGTHGPDFDAETDGHLIHPGEPINDALFAAAEFFWPRLVSGAVIILDDYGYSDDYVRQKRAFDTFARTKNVQVLLLPTGQGLIFKP